MRKTMMTAVGMTALMLVACGDLDDDAMSSLYDQVTAPGGGVPLCSTTAWQDPTAAGAAITTHAVKPLISAAQCGCPVSGLLKYVDHARPRKAGGGTKALVYYGNGACDGWALKNLCHEGRCEAENGGTFCLFKVECAKDREPRPLR